ncbi:zinc-dependent peptidase [Hymenobacter nivis]|uniref:Zinc-dependent peptidase n=1 Tax=Hymenobacter nivis TaxID=1850093 RepID=A0A502GD60_9BACT|nr:M90 family metallopeptidase [Hymenobacter nivis]TPG58976.1 zinc-dependent peptidase [Hymenobacter nivis]
MPYFLSLAVLAAVVFGFYRYATADSRRRAAALAAEFPPAWRALLAEHVAFYGALSEAERARFEQRVQLFLADARITGVQTEVDELTRLLVAAAAVIPTFGFPEWTYAHLGEVLVVPDAWVLGPDATQEVAPLQGTLLGSVQRFQNQHYMRLSKASLRQGFANPEDQQNVGIHEFAHLLDEADGVIDGVPQVALPPHLLKPWAAAVHREMEALRAGQSDINPYAGTNEAEFFAVVTEYFFEKPEQLHAHHPELYALLTELFNQRPGARRGPNGGPRQWLRQLWG